MSNSDELDEILSEIRNRQNHESTDNPEASFATEPKKDEPAQDAEVKLHFDGDTEKQAEADEEPTAPLLQPEPEENTPKDTDAAEDVYTDVFSDEGGESSAKPYAPLQNDAVIGAEEYPEEDMGTNSNKKKIIIAAVAVIAVIAVIIGVYFGFIHKQPADTPTVTEPATETTTAAPAVIMNPFTGETEYNSAAIGKRPVACVVENAQAARPQWGIDSPDIIVEGEVEGGETRMLWLYADYTAVPDQIGPIRSARPPYIRFSEMFDAVFIHWGQSKSKGNYVGANTVFKQDDVDHINQMSYSGKTSLFSRDSSRNVSSEHTGILHGDKIADALKELKIRTDVNEQNFTTFSFNEKAEKMSENACNTLALTFSSRTRTRDWAYNTEDQMYHSTDYETDVKMKNLIVLFDTTTYITKENYKGTGKGETYCDYGLDGGKGVVASEGTYTEITWSKKDGKLVLQDADGQTLKLNPGKSWIGYASSNNGGKVSQG